MLLLFEGKQPPSPRKRGVLSADWKTGLDFPSQTYGVSKGGIQGGTRVQRRDLGPGTPVSSLDWGLPEATVLHLVSRGQERWVCRLTRVRRCSSAASASRSEQALGAHRGPGCCRDQCSLGLAGQDSSLPRLISSTTAGLLLPLSYSPSPRGSQVLANSMAWPRP